MLQRPRFGSRINADHRPWPVPGSPWLMAQSWHDLLFAHWPIPAAEMRRVMPAALPVDTFDGQAWVGVVPFRMTGVRMRGTPNLPGISAFPEINVRTYTVIDGKPGVYFFSLDAANRIAVETARRWFKLPYYLARMQFRAQDESIFYESRRAASGPLPAEFVGRYRPTGEPAHAVPGTFAYWATERYCLYTADSTGHAARAEILHEPWPLQPAASEISWNTIVSPTGLHLPDSPPILHFSRRLDVVVWAPRRV